MADERDSNPASSYVQCARCGFWVTRDQATCPNCGIEKPANKGFWKLYPKPTTIRFNLGAAACFGGMAMLATISLRSVVGFFSDPFFAEALIPNVVPCAIGLVTSAFMYWAGCENNRRSASRQGDCFQQIARSLQERLALPQSLRDSEQQLTERIGELQGNGQDTAALDKALTTVRQAIVTAQEQSAHAQLLLQRIAMLRWQNKLEPLVMEAVAGDNVNVYKQRLQQAEALENEGRGLLTAFTEPAFQPVEERHFLANDARVSEDEAQLRKTWEELLAGCERLKNELITQQALAAVEQVQSPVRNSTLQATTALDERQARAKVIMTTDFGNLQRAVADLREQETRLRANWEEAEKRAAVEQGIGA